MAITFRNYTAIPFFTDDYRKVREFLMRINAKTLYTPRMPWGAWEWAVTHGGRDQDKLDRIGLWEDDDNLVAVATYECPLGEAYLMVDEAYPHLKPEMIAYAKKALHDNGNIRLILSDNDHDFQRSAQAQGFRPTQRKDCVSVLDISALQPYTLPEGFTFVDMTGDWNWHQYNRVMWRGFNHEGKPAHDDETIAERKQMLSSPMLNPELVIAVVAPDGNYVSHCTMWYKPGDFYCYVEPVATDPEYRKMGLGKAAVLETVRRSGQQGASQAVVGSDQQFYYNIGFYPAHTLTHWELVKAEC